MREWMRRAAAVGCVVVIAVFAGVFIYNMVSIEEWRQTAIGDGYWNDAGKFLSTVMLDSDGNPHVVYTKSDSIGHAWTESGKWVTADCPVFHYDTTTKSCCAAMAPDDRIHAFVSYRSSSTSGPDSTMLTHLTYADGEWNERKVQGLPEFYKYSTHACSVDSQNEIHVLSVGVNFTLYAENEFDLHVVYWHFDGYEWSVSKVLPIPPEWNGDNEYARVTDMAIDQNGGIHALVYSWNAEPWNVAYISSAGGEWVFEPLNLSCDGFPQIVLNDDQPLIGLFESDSGDISVVAEEDSGWEELFRVSSGWKYNNFGLDLAIDSEGTLHMVHVYDDLELEREVRHTTYSAGSAVTSTICDSIAYGSQPSIATDADGQSHISLVTWWDVTYITNTPDDGALTDAAVDAIMKALLVTAVLGAVALMALGALGLRRFRSWQIARFNEEPEEREKRRSPK